MKSSDSRRGLPSRWAGVGAKLPPALENLAGPSGGVVELPVDLACYTSWLNAGLLRGDWSRLRLPPPPREIWQEHFPELGPG